MSYPYPSWQVHRGYHREGLRENTTESIAFAFSHGAEMIECDVRINRWGELFLCHDATLERVFGLKIKAKEKTLTELKKIGLMDIEELIEQFPNKYLNIELKKESYGSIQKVKKTLEIIKKHDASDRVLISSFDPYLLRLVKYYCRSQKTALIFDSKDKVNGLKFRIFDIFSGCDFWHLSEEGTKHIFQANLKKPAAVWTVNNYGRAKSILERGFCSIISDLLPPSK